MNQQVVTFNAFLDTRTNTYQVASPQEIHGWGKPKTDNTDKPALFKVPQEQHSGWNWAPWGVKDDVPTVVRQMVEKEPMAGQTIYRLMAMMYGDGLAYYRNEDLAKVQAGEEVPRHYEPEVEAWLSQNMIRQRYLLPQFLAYRYTTNSFSEAILSKDKKMITGLFHLDSEYCRKSRQNPNSRRSDYLYYSAEFASNWRSDISEGAAIPLIDWHDVNGYLDNLNGYKAAWHSYLPTPGSLYYATAPWHGLFRSKGWIENATAIPEIIYAMAHNQIQLKYELAIPISLFELRYGDEWNTYDYKKKGDLMDEFAAMLEDELADVDNAYKSITSFFGIDHNGNETGRIQITAIDDKLKRDSWVPSANAAHGQIVQTLGAHPSQFGLAPEGGKMGAGSGSDQRESFNTMQQVNTLEQEIELGMLNNAARFNARYNSKWDLTFYIAHTRHTTINDQESGLQPEPGSLILN